MLALPALAVPLYIGSLAAGVAEHASWGLALEEARVHDAAYDTNPVTQRLCAAILAHGDPQNRASAQSTWPCGAR